ncbi:MAG: AMP-binding protein [bacterium]
MNLADNLKNTAERFPERTAGVFYDRRISYEQLYRDVSRFAYALGGMDVGPGTRVALVSPNTPDYCVGFYGALAAGAEVVAVNPLYTPREMEYIFRDSNVTHVIVNPMFEESAKEAIRERSIRVIYSDAMGDPAKPDIKKLIASAGGEAAPANRAPQDTALIVYTNAYNGYYMGACLTHEGLIFDAEACKTVSATVEEDAFFTVIPLFHAFSATVNMNLPILVGGKIVFHEMFKEERVIEDLEKERVSIFAAVPTVFRRLLEKFGSAGKDYSWVKAFVPGGATMPVKLIEDFSAAFNANMYEGYGITECGPVTTSNPIYKRESKPGSVGQPLEGVRVRFVSPDGRILPPGERGELAVSGKNVMSGYLNRPEETAKFVKDGWFYTGDEAWQDEEGYVYLTGHVRRLILVGGFNVYPEEVERLLMERPEVQSCRVYGIPDVSLGEKVMAEATLKPGVNADAGELRKYLRSMLAAYKTPRRVEIIG